MELRNASNGEFLEQPSNPRNHGEHFRNPNPYLDDFDSNCSTPYVSAPSSPGRASHAAPCGYFFSAPASPVHYVLSSAAFSAGGIASAASPALLQPSGGSFEFGGSSASGPMISADELFLDGQIRPMKLSSHLQRPQALAPLLDLEEEDEGKDGENGGRGREMRLRSRSIHRRARSMSPMRNSRFLRWEEEGKDTKVKEVRPDLDLDPKPDDPVTPPDSASSSRSSSSGRNSKRWIFLKDLLHRSKSEGSGRTSNGKEKEKFWSISFSPSKEKSSKSPPIPPSSSEIEKEKKQKKSGNGNPPVNGVGKRRGPATSAHERHYTANRAQAEEMRRRTFLPYRQGLLGCLGFSSRGYGAVNGFAKTLNTVSSRKRASDEAMRP